MPKLPDDYEINERGNYDDEEVEDNFFRDNDEPDYDADKYAAYLWAHQLISGELGDWVVLHSQTTGLHSTAEIVDLAILSKYRSPLINTLVRPGVAIPSDATRFHGITDAMVKNAPTWEEIDLTVGEALADKNVVMYNAAFNSARLDYMCNLFPGSDERIFDRSGHCAMHHYAKYCGDWDTYYKNYRWQKLPVGSNRALDGAIAIYDLIKQMAQPLQSKVRYVGDLFPPVQLGCRWKRWGFLQLVRDWNVRWQMPIVYPRFEVMHRNLRCVEDFSPLL
ncbi:MAG: 3'-5' exonuclease [Hydrococcus sp. RU_2_2]|nr:3'-5' exonuclease [Hydrococcus sp. RU_2_2]NJP21697.1 3'-5' exonuclease [Hydrococcus sp. CRU_1_1]